MCFAGHGPEGGEGEAAERPHQAAGVVLGRQGVRGQVRVPRHPGAGVEASRAQQTRNAGTGFPAYSDTAYSDTPLTVTLWAGPKSFINEVSGYSDIYMWLQ